MSSTKRLDEYSVVEALELSYEAMVRMADQIEQMSGLFTDSDGAIDSALELYADAEMASRYALQAHGGKNNANQ